MRECLLCNEDDLHGADLIRHTGRHLLDLALWALPRSGDDLEPNLPDVVDDISAEESELEYSSSDEASTTGSKVGIRLPDNLERVAEHINMMVASGPSDNVPDAMLRTEANLLGHANTSASTASARIMPPQSFSPAENQQINQLAQGLMARATPQVMDEIKKRIQSTSPAQRQMLAAQGIDPLHLHFRRIAQNQFLHMKQQQAAQQLAQGNGGVAMSLSHSIGTPNVPFDDEISER